MGGGRGGTVTPVSVSNKARAPIKVPARYATVIKRKLVKGGMMEWREILCDTNMTKGRIIQIQQALLKLVHNPGAIDVIGQSTMKAVNAFQRQKKLPVDQYLHCDSSCTRRVP